MRSKGVWLTRFALSALVLLFVGACSDDSTGPGATDVDVENTQATVDAVINQFFTQNQGLQSLQIFGTAITTTFPSIAPAELVPSAESATFYGMADRMRASMRALMTRKVSDASLMAIPTQFLETTFEYNPQTGQYEPSTRTGAPSNGVRFILYDDVSTLNEIGHLDLIDASNFGVVPASIDITLSVVVTSIGEVLNYRITGSVSDTGGTLLVNGFISDGTDQLDFDFTVSGSDTTGFDGRFTLSAGTLSLTLDFSEGTAGAQRIEVTITDGTDEILFVLNSAADGTIQTGSGIFFNNTPVAVFSGNLEQDNVTIANTEGDPLTPQQLLALGQIFAGLEQAFAAMEGLFALGLGLIGIVFFF
jgi:hypothetical protein